MYTINDIKVELLNPEEVKNFIKNHGIFVLLNQTKGTMHGYDAVKNSSITKENVQKRIEALKATFNTFKN